MPWCALLSALKNYTTKVFKNCKAFSSRPRPRLSFLSSRRLETKTPVSRTTSLVCTCTYVDYTRHARKGNAHHVAKKLTLWLRQTDYSHVSAIYSHRRKLHCKLQCDRPRAWCLSILPNVIEFWSLWRSSISSEGGGHLKLKVNRLSISRVPIFRSREWTDCYA